MQALTQTVIPAVVAFLQGLFTVIGSLVSFSVIFYGGMIMIENRHGNAVTKISQYDRAEKARAEKHLRARVGICSVAFGIFSFLLAVGIIVLNFACTGIFGGIFTALGCIGVLVMFFGP